MPIYEYECAQGHRFEELQKVSDAPLTTCKECDQPVRKLISNTAFHLKGGGWYKDGYGSTAAPAETTKPSSDTQRPEPKAQSATTSDPQTPTKKETAQ